MIEMIPSNLNFVRGGTTKSLTNISCDYFSWRFKSGDNNMMTNAKYFPLRK